MSGIAQIIQAMMSVSPQVTPMAGGQGGGRIPIPSASAASFGGNFSGRTSPGVGTVQRIDQEEVPEMIPGPTGPRGLPGQPSGPNQMGPPVPEGYIRPERESPMEIIQRAFAQNEVAIQELQMDNTPQGVMAQRENLPGLLQQREALKAQAAEYNQQSGQAAQDQRYQRALQILMDNNVPRERADPLARQAALDEKAFEQIMGMAMGERESINQLMRDQKEEFRQETDVAHALKRAIHDMDDESASYLAATGLPIDQLAQMWRDDKVYVKEQAEKLALEQIKVRDELIKVDQNISNTRKAIGDVGPFTAGVGSLLKFLPGTPAANLDKALDTLRASTAFEELFRMRQASPTGGALGNVSNREIELLYSAWTALQQEQQPDRLRGNLNELLERYQRVKYLIEAESRGELRGVSGVEQKRMADEFVNKTHIDAARSVSGPIFDEALEDLRNGEVSKQWFEDTFGFLPIMDTLQ